MLLLVCFAIAPRIADCAFGIFQLENPDQAIPPNFFVEFFEDAFCPEILRTESVLRQDETLKCVYFARLGHLFAAVLFT